MSAPDPEGPPFAWGAACHVLRALDGQLQAIILVGSCVHTPELARDIDLALVSASPRPALRYAAAAGAALGQGRPVDALVRWPDQPLGAMRLAYAAGRVLWRRRGDALATTPAVATPDDFGEARRQLCNAVALEATGATGATLVADRSGYFLQEAFEGLFQAARTAVMALLALRPRQRPSPALQREFRRVVLLCHLRYGRGDSLPTGAGARAEFRAWCAIVQGLLDACEAAALGLILPPPARPLTFAG